MEQIKRLVLLLRDQWVKVAYNDQYRVLRLEDEYYTGSETQILAILNLYRKHML